MTPYATAEVSAERPGTGQGATGAVGYTAGMGTHRVPFRLVV
jgi:hypothetical protein